ncbi:MAG: 16S rRNA (uracil(1498)-N(3))-methyltransferase [Verrucomicrobia bacterium]|nr:16S rRNA (uracil(1498)-N(3))-methyltransferase [Verrucomicrobiota bacterium]
MSSSGDRITVRLSHHTMHRFFVPQIPPDVREIRLPEAEVHHAARVLRVQVGDPVRVLDGAGGVGEGVVASVGRREVLLQIERQTRHAPPSCRIELLQAIAKGPAMEGLLHRAVELGCARLVPLLADRSVSRPDDGTAKQARWEALAVEAAKQSGNVWRMVVERPMTPADWIARGARPELLLIASLELPVQSPRRALESFRIARGRGPASVGLLIGPEGDFTAAEYAAFRGVGAVPIGLGPHVLRVETAATAALAILGNELETSVAV